MQPASHATLFYDGRCPLCLKEMQRLEEIKDTRLRLQDIHALPANADLPDRDTLLRTLHLQLPDGSLLTGLDANVAAWQYTRYGAWWRWLRWPLIGPLASMVYTAWARWRYRRLYPSPCSNDKDSCDAPD